MNAAVFDTNVLVSGLLSPHGPPGLLVDALVEGRCHAVLDDRLWDEYTDVLARPKFGFHAEDIALLLCRIAEHGIQASAALVNVVPDALPDPADLPFIECATAAGVPLVTGNLQHYPPVAVGDVEVLSPAAYLRRLRATTVTTQEGVRGSVPPLTRG